ncbi:Metalloprotease, specifically cleaves on the N-terminal side of aspartyl, glutamyl and cysteic acid residues (By similarity) [Seminavis robusta]|uniref:Metalloprotease, specifically cleaves on the N-terminal side of aspartyl, glutamyl and cysteic acid residues By similarity n=1 Tax=Seminavis robusta TaxID=568900 RepID=A0A9N8H5F6_9STRA|nr:Metalloprotease, specifically cleaves on the N-terminal side of aspartyl, glutamyl and cysteic acid residues (By similarity) [Seminavis robusta]|eukprot:Sro73_g040330.1 Metalloprotease, specifically cleaves on the N-terminal side of aspartyl, glutamyl and cysteic acid residues (By similarity) (440) ;mRNA; r:52849-54697
MTNHRGCSVVAVLVALLSRHVVIVRAQDIIPRTDVVIDDTETRDDVVYVDTSPLGTDFYEYETLNIQLLDEGPVWTLRNTFKTGAYFDGETKDHMISISLMRYTSENTGQSVVTGVVHDRKESLFYEIRPDHKGRETVLMTLEDDMPPLGDPIQPSFLERITTFGDSTSIASTWNYRINNFLGIQRQDPGPTIIDVMIIWTESTECYKSGLSTGCSRSSTTQTNMEAAVDLMIQETNTALTNSDTGAQIRLVHRQVDSSGYRESRMTTTLRQVSDVDGVMDYIHSLRNQYRADLVQFIVDNRVDADGLGGVAWLPQCNGLGCWNSALGFSCICAQCMMNYISAHEFGHNLNCLHDRGTANACSTCDTSNYGYRSPNGNFRSIMAYRCRTGECDNNPGGSCPRIGFYSGNFQYNGESVGGDTNNCAGEITNMMFHIHNYR